MSQDNMVKMECTVCKHTNYFSRKNKRTIKDRLELQKFCKFCPADENAVVPSKNSGKKIQYGRHTLHKETK